MDMIEDEEKANYVLDIPFHFHLEAAKGWWKWELMVSGWRRCGFAEGDVNFSELWRKYLKPNGYHLPGIKKYQSPSKNRLS